MAAAYQTGSATGVVDVLQKLVTFLVAQGWTSNMSQVDGSGWRAHLVKSGQYVNLRAYVNADTNSNIWQTTTTPNTQKNGIALYLGNAYSGAASWRAQGGGPVKPSGSEPIGANVIVPSNTITAYHFFDDGANNITVVLEKVSGTYGAFGWGKLQAAGTITGGGDYFFGQVPSLVIGDVNSATPAYSYTLNGACPMSYGGAYYNSTQFQARAYVKVDVDTFTGKWISMGLGADGQSGTGWTAYSEVPPTSGSNNTDVPMYVALMDRSNNAANGRGILLPINVYAARAAGGVSLIGRVPPLFVTSKTYAPTQVVTYGANSYMAFPMFYTSTPKTGFFLVPKP